MMDATSGDDAHRVSVVLPVFNEAGHLHEEIARIRAGLEAAGLDYEIIVVDDGSTDGSSERLREMEDIRLVQYGSNRGSGFARRAGSAVARGDVVVWTDVDMTYPNERIPELVAGLDGHDQVVGARTSEEGTVKLFRVPAKWTIRKMAEFLAGQKIPDLNSGMRAFRREVLVQFLHLMPNGFSHVTTATMTFLANNYSVGYVPIDYAMRHGTSKFHWLKDTQRYMTQVARMIMLYQPLRIFLPAALLLLGIGLVKLVYDVVTRDFAVAINTVVLLLSGVSLVILGLLADLVVQLNKSSQHVDPAAFTVREPTARPTRTSQVS